MNKVDKQYLEMAKLILAKGEPRETRSGEVISLFSPGQMRFDLSEGFPVLTTKKVYLSGVIHELIWFLRGDTNIKYLVDNNVNIWNQDAYRHYLSRLGPNENALTFEEFIFAIKHEGNDTLGDLGTIYGAQWRRCPSIKQYCDCSGHISHETTKPIDQINELVNQLRENPFSRRHLVSAWNVGELGRMALPPCHVMFQCYVSNNGELSLHMYQRSGDYFLGVPFNITSYALLTHMIAQVTGYYAKWLIITLGDAHIYKNHVEQIKEQLKREPRRLPKLHLNPEIKNIDDFTYEDIVINGYDPHGPIKGKLSVGE